MTEPREGVAVTRGSPAFLSRRLFSLVILIFTSCTFAQRVEITSPLQGYARSGHCAAIQISADALTGQTLTISGAGVVPLQVPIVNGKIDAVAPLLFQGEPPAEINWSDGAASGTVPMSPRTLATDERLILIGGNPRDAAGLIAELFPGRQPIILHLDLSQSKLLQPAMAYESVDAVLLDTAAAARIDETLLHTLVAAGTTIAIDTPHAVAGWPWKAVHGWSVLQHEPGGPGGGPEQAIYDPAGTWDTSWPLPMRRMILFTSLAAAIVVAAPCLLRRRAVGLIATLVACAALAIAAALYSARLPNTATACGEVLYWDGTLSQYDRITYVYARKATTAQVSAGEGITKPILFSQRPIPGLSFQLICDGTGAPVRYEVNLPIRNKIAFLTRSVAPAPPPTNLQPPNTSPISLFADRLYPGSPAGNAASRPADATADDWWGTVVMKK